MGETGLRTQVSALAALALVLLQFGAIRLAPSDAYVRVILPLTIAAAPVVLWRYRHFVGVWVIFVGLAANLAAILANGGLMPIERATVVTAIGDERAAAYTDGEWIEGSKDVLVGEGSRRAVALGDNIVVRIGSGGIVASPGDLVVLVGLVTALGEAAMLGFDRRRAKATLEQAAVEARLSRARGGAPT